MSGVPSSPDFRRIVGLPRRAPRMDEDYTSFFARPGGTMRLRPIQSWALAEMAECGGGFLPIGVGHGKTLIGLLAATALGARKLTYVTRPQLARVVCEVEIPKYAAHFFVPEDRIEVVSYEDLSSYHRPRLLEELCPDAFFFDEAHGLRHLSAARTRRVREWLRAHPETKVVAASGTFTGGRLRDWAHLADWSLGDGSPVPRRFFAVEDWSNAIDAQPLSPMGPGKLMSLCDHDHGDKDVAHKKFRCRLVETPGVVATDEGALGTSLVFRARRPTPPAAVAEALESLRESWAFAGEEATDVLSFHRLANQLSMGFYYRKVWSAGEDQLREQVEREWKRYARGWLKRRARPGLDTLGHLDRAVRDTTVTLDDEGLAAWRAWEVAQARPGPDREPVWLSDFVVADAKGWMAEGPSGVIWYRDVAVGEKLVQDLGIPMFGPGAGVELAKTRPEDDPYVAVSIKAHLEGQNLQAWNRNLIVGMTSAQRLEQLVGRTHRPGQMADEVSVEMYQHSVELENSMAHARRRAEVIENTMWNRQKLNYAVFVGFNT